MISQKARLSEGLLVRKYVRMISQKARLSEGPLVRKSDNYLIEITLICEQPYYQLFAFIFVLVPVTMFRTFIMVMFNNRLLNMLLNLMLLR